MSMNSKLGSNKFSTAEKSMNKVILVYIGILIAEVVLCSSLRYAYSFDLQYDSFKEIYSGFALIGRELHSEEIFSK